MKVEDKEKLKRRTRTKLCAKALALRQISPLIFVPPSLPRV